MDFIKDQNPTALYEVGIKAGDSLPDYVKEATLLQEEDVKDLNDLAFADPVKRLHPIHTKAAAYMSAVYLAGNGQIDSKEFQVVKQAAEFFEIESDIEAALQLLPQVEKSASNVSTDAYALQFTVEEDDTWKSYPINNDVELSKSATDVVKDWCDGYIPTDWFWSASRNIVKKASELNIPRNSIPERIWNMGEERAVDFETAELAIGERARFGLSDTSDYAAALKSAAEGKTTVEAAIDTWMGLDTVNNINHRLVTTPHEAFYSGVKLAHVEALANNNVFIANVMVPASEVVKVLDNDAKAVKRAFRKEAAENIINIISGLKQDTEKFAAVVSQKVSSLEMTQQKQLLNLLLKAA
jgi:hypothetical protein